MKTVFYSNNGFRKLKPFHLVRNTINTEADFFIMNGHPTRVIKKYRNPSDTYLKNKVNTVFDLYENRHEINIPELNLQDRVVFVESKMIGFAAPYVKGLDTGIILNGKNVPIKTKITILKQIGEILKKVDNHNKDFNLAFGDVHPGNFIFNGERTKAIDTDSMKIHDNVESPSLYLVRNNHIGELKKYSCNPYGIYFASPDSDIFSFINIIYRVLAGDEMFKLSIYKYNKYLEYLDSLGVDTNLLNAMASVYQDNKENINPTPYLDNIGKFVEKANINEFRKSRFY